MKDTAARKMLAILKEAYPQARCELIFSNPLELMVATILSAQCTDKRVNQVTQGLFRKYRRPEDYAKAACEELMEDIRPTGFYKNKAKFIQGCCRGLVERHGSRVPADLEALVKLPGIGRKTANVILGHAFGIPGITTDTHVIRVSQRLGLTTNTDPEKIERDLQAFIRNKDWTLVSDALIFHGRYCCYARRPNCPECPVLKLCPYSQKTT